MVPWNEINNNDNNNVYCNTRLVTLVEHPSQRSTNRPGLRANSGNPLYFLGSLQRSQRFWPVFDFRQPCPDSL